MTHIVISEKPVIEIMRKRLDFAFLIISQFSVQ